MLKRLCMNYFCNKKENVIKLISSKQSFFVPESDYFPNDRNQSDCLLEISLFWRVYKTKLKIAYKPIINYFHKFQILSQLIHKCKYPNCTRVTYHI